MTNSLAVNSTPQSSSSFASWLSSEYHTNMSMVQNPLSTIGGFFVGLGQGAVNIVTGAGDTVVEVVRTGGDLVTIYSNWDNIDPSQLNSTLFQGAVQTAGSPEAAAAFDNQLVFGVVTLGVGPLVQSGYNAVVTGDSTAFSQQAGGFGTMVLVPYAGVKGLNALPPVRVWQPVFQPGAVLVMIDGTRIAVPGGISLEAAGVIPIVVPAETATAIAGTVMAMSITGDGSGTAPVPAPFDPANFVGSQAITPAHLPAGDFCALVVDGRVYVARMHNVAWELAGRTGNVEFYGSATIDATGRVVRLFQ